jgi:hypothetical protein
VCFRNRNRKGRRKLDSIALQSPNCPIKIEKIPPRFMNLPAPVASEIESREKSCDDGPRRYQEAERRGVDEF